MTYPGYRENASTRWLEVGSVPVGWEVRRLKFAVSPRNEKIEAEATNLEYLGLEHIESWTGRRIEDEAASSEGIATRFVKGDVVFGKLRPYLAKVYLAEKEGIATTEALVLTAEPALVPEFLNYLLLSPKFIDAVSGSTYGAKMPRANWDTIGGQPILLPPLREQRQIAAFLDWKTRQIEALIARKKELIETLKEKRLAVITQAVTKGLSRNARLCDSGIPWLGFIPEHWETMQLRRRWEVVDCKHKTVSYVDEGVPMASIREVHGLEVNLESANKTTWEEYLSMIEGGRKPMIGDIIYSRNVTVGDAAIVTSAEPFCMGQDVCLLRSSNAFPRFLSFLLRSHFLREQAEALMVGSTFKRINVGQIKGLWVTVPPIDEQVAIAAHLDKATGHIDSMAEKADLAIAFLTEYRAALITAATIGKIDVRQIAIPASA